MTATIIITVIILELAHSVDVRITASATATHGGSLTELMLQLSGGRAEGRTSTGETGRRVAG